jgi:hypothetical protein
MGHSGQRVEEIRRVWVEREGVMGTGLKRGQST